MEIKKYTKKDGSTAYMFNVYVGLNSKGKNVYRKRQGFKTKKQAQIALAKLLEDIEENGIDIKPSISTFQQLYDKWLTQHKMNVKESTIVTLTSFIKSQILPNFGSKKLDSITVMYCQQVLNDWYNDDLKCYKQLRTITSQILSYGETMEVIQNNPMSKTILPRKKETGSRLKFFTKQQLEFFFECLEMEGDYKQFTFFRLLAFTGARKAEILALQWKDIDLFNKTITVGKTIARGEKGRMVIQSPKTSAGKRTISIDDQTIKFLSTWQSYQRQDYLKMGFNTAKGEQFLFTNKRNQLTHTTQVNNWLKRLISKYDLPNITPHHFRHTHASLLLQSGIPVKEVSERLGHKDVRVTLEIYSHVMPEEAEKTADKFAQFVGF